MTTNESNIYKAPEASLDAGPDATGVHNFERFTAWGVFGLSIITFGIYPAYWLYTRSKTLNSFHHEPISMNLLNAFIGTVVASFAVGFLGGVMGGGTVVETISGLIQLVYFVLYLVVLFTFRSRLKDVTGAKVNPVLTVFAAAIYLQYKINKCIDNS